jgi:hypothetical protein
MVRGMQELAAKTEYVCTHTHTHTITYTHNHMHTYIPQTSKTQHFWGSAATSPNAPKNTNT